MKYFVATFAVSALYLLAFLAYIWSFTDSVFGGYLGLLLPPVIGILLFISGFIAGKSTNSEPIPESVRESFLKPDPWQW